jgi:hypothetical protein
MPSENTIFEVCSYLKNWFDRNQPKYFGNVSIINGALSETYDLKVGQYFRIVGSTLNDGVYQYPITTLTDETFNGAIWGMALPKAFIALLDDIEAWKIKYNSLDTQDGRQALSPFNSESFGGYAYSKSSGGTSDTTKDKSGTWQGVFGARLAPYRQM